MLGLDYNERVTHEMSNIPLSFYHVDDKHPAGSLTPKIAESLIWLIFFNKFKFLVDRTAVLCYNTIIVQKGNVVYEIKN